MFIGRSGSAPERSLIGNIGVYLAGSLLALFFGLLASSANPVLIGLAVGLIGGVALLAAPALCVDIVLVLGLLSGFVLSLLGPGSGKLGWALALLGMLLLALALFRLLVERIRAPGFIWLALLFILYACLTTLAQLHSMAELIAGFKRYFQMFGLMFALALLPFTEQRVGRWLKMLLGIALIQLPFALYERFVMAAARGHGAEATDVVAGTLGANMTGGSANAQMAAFLIMAVAFLAARWRAGLIGKPLFLACALICLLPLGLGETKIVLVLLPLTWAVIMRHEIIRSPGVFFLQLIALALLTVLFGSIYVGLNNRGAEEVLNETLRYNVGSGGYGFYLLNRTSVFSFWWTKHGGDLAAMLFGHGLGSSYSSAGNIVPGHLYTQYFGYGIDLTTASSLLWDTGLLGFLLYLGMLGSAWSAAGRLCRSGIAAVRADALALQACIAGMGVFVFYDNALINYMPFEVITAAALGYLAYLVRRSEAVTPARRKKAGL